MSATNNSNENNLPSAKRRKVNESIGASPPAESPFAGLFDTGLYSDLVLECEGRQFKVHKALVCPQSPVLTAQMRDQWQEAQSGVIRVDEFDAGTMLRFLQFLYKKDYPTAALGDSSEGDSECAERNRVLLVHARVVAAADNYQVDVLKEMAAERFRAVDLIWASKGFGSVVSTVYSILAPQDRTLKAPVVAMIQEHWASLKSDSQFMEDLARIGQCAVEVLEILCEDKDQLICQQSAHTKRISKLEKDSSSWRKRHGEQATAKTTAQKAVENLTQEQTKSQQLIDTLQAEVTALETALSQSTETEYSLLVVNPRESTKIFNKLKQLYHGCCGDDPTEALASLRDNKWIFRCRRCSRKYTVENNRARSLTLCQDEPKAPENPRYRIIDESDEDELPFLEDDDEF